MKINETLLNQQEINRNEHRQKIAAHRPAGKKGGGIDRNRHYDATDLEFIQIMKHREDLGLSFHHSLETVRIYRDSITRAVQEDIRLFINKYGPVQHPEAVIPGTGKHHCRPRLPAFNQRTNRFLA